MKLLSGTANRPLAEGIARYVDVPLTHASVRRFADNELFVEILENMRGQDVFVVQPTSFPANDHMMELLIWLDALKRASPARITAVLPYYGYARQDRKTGPRTPISAKLVANLITTAGANRVLTLDLHANQIQGFFDVPLDNLYAAPVFYNDIRNHHNGHDVVIVSPDVGGLLRARAIAKPLDADLAIIDKRRERAGESEVINIIGDIKGRRCILIDDIVDSAGTLCNAAQALADNGASWVAAYCTHGVLSGIAVERIGSSPLETLVITDSIEASKEARASNKIRVLSVAPLLGEAIRRISKGDSVSSLFSEGEVAKLSAVVSD
jgi:ribose-phosphate pyrophosphokinase